MAEDIALNDTLEVVVKTDYLGQPVLQVHHMQALDVQGAGQTMTQVLDPIQARYTTNLPQMLVIDATIVEVTIQIIDRAVGVPPDVLRGLIYPKTLNQPGLVSGQGLPGQAAAYVSEKGVYTEGENGCGGFFIGAIGEADQDDGLWVQTFRDRMDTYIADLDQSLTIGDATDNVTLVPIIYSRVRRGLEPPKPADPPYQAAISLYALDIFVSSQDRRRRGSPTGGF